MAAHTFSFERQGRFHIHFLQHSADDFASFVAFLGEKLGAEVGPVETLAFIRTCDFGFAGSHYVAVAGDDDEPHIVAPDAPARVALLDRFFGAGAHLNPADHSVAPS